MLINATKKKSQSESAAAAYQTKLVPPPDPTEAVLLFTFPVSDDDLETLAAARAKTVENYFLQSGKVQPSHLFLAAKGTGHGREGSRVYLQPR